MGPVEEILNRREQELKAGLEEVQRLRELALKVPGLILIKDFNGFEAAASPVVNQEATGIEIRKSDGLCYEAWPYKEVEGHRVNSQPPHFTLGHRNLNGSGIRSHQKWDALMREVGIPEALIKSVREYLAAHPAHNTSPSSADTIT